MSSSISEEINTMLSVVVAGALLGPTPAKRKAEAQQSPRSSNYQQEQRCPNVEAATASIDQEPLFAAKKPKLEPALASPPPPGAVAAAASAAFPATLAPIPQPCFPFAARPRPAMDLEAAVGELMGELLPSTQPADAASATVEVAPAPAAAAVPPELVAAAAEPETSDEPSETHEMAEADELDLQPTQACSGSAGSPEAAAPTGAAAAALTGAAVAAPTDPAAAAPSNAAAASIAATSPTAHQSAPAAPHSAPAAHHSVPAAAAPEPTSQPTELPPCPAAAAAAAAPSAAPPADAACMPPAASPASGDGAGTDTAPGSIQLHGRPAAMQPQSTPPAVQLPEALASTHVNLLKGDIEQDFGELSSSPSGGCGGWTTSGSQAHPSLAQSAPAASPPSPPHRTGAPTQLADYELEADREVGSGGLGRVYAAVHGPSGRKVALKLGSAFVKEDGPKDFTWSTFLTEWNIYARLAGRCSSSSGSSSAGGLQLPWLAEPFEFGLWEDGSGGVAPWLTMSLLGPSVHTLNQKHHGSVVAHLGDYARGMLAALEGLHRQGLIHNDVKPANFVARHGFDPSELQPPQEAAPAAAAAAAAAAGQGAWAPLQQARAAHPAAFPQIFLIDFGFTLKWDPSRVGKRYEFVGTPDFAASRVLVSRRPGLRDDLEALGYTLLELALGELPWDITKLPDSKGRARDVTTWDAAALKGMLDRRDAAWELAVEQGKVPTWLVEWVGYCRELHPAAQPDYSRLRGLIKQGEHEAAAAAAKAELARVRDATWLAEE